MTRGLDTTSEMYARMLRHWSLAKGKQPHDDEAQLVVRAKRINPNAWAFKSWEKARFDSLEAAERLLSDERAAESARVEYAPAPVRVAWLARLLRPFKLVEA